MARNATLLAVVGATAFIARASSSACEPPPDPSTFPPVFLPAESDEEYPSGSFGSLAAYYASLGTWTSSPPAPGDIDGSQPDTSPTPTPQETTKTLPASSGGTPNETNSRSSRSGSHSDFGEPSAAPTPSIYAFTEAQPSPAPARGVQSRIGFIVGASTAAGLILVLLVSAIGTYRARKRAANTTGAMDAPNNADHRHAGEVSIAIASAAESERFYSVANELGERSTIRGRASSMTRCETENFHSCLSETTAP